MKIRIYSLLFAAISLAASTATGATTYVVTNLGTLTNGNFSRAYSVNNLGQVTGEADVSGNPRTFFYSSGAMSDPGALGYGTVGYGVNDSGQVAGANSNDGSAFLWDSNTNTNQPITVPNATFPDGVQSVGFALNNAGQVVGYVTINGGPAQAFIWDGTNGMQNLNAISSGAFALAEGISSNGTVVGQSESSAFSGAFIEATIWVGGSPQGLGFLDVLAFNYSYGLGVNDAGNATGASTSSNGQRGFFWDGNTMVDLGVLLGGGDETYTRGWSVNNSNQVVGSSASATGQRAFYWENGTLIDLNDLVLNLSGWTLVEARSISDTGFIAGWGYFNGEQRGFLLTPTPEPSSWMLLSMGVGMAAFVRRRRTRG